MIDTTISTYNSERRLHQCLTAIKKYVPIHEIIIIDNYSSDRTIEIAESFGCRIIQTHQSLAESRKTGFQMATTKYVAVIDSDIIITKDWYTKIMKCFNSPLVGAAWGAGVEQSEPHHSYQTAMYHLKPDSKYSYPRLHNTIILRELVIDVVFPKLLLTGSVAGEDYWIKHWITKKGYRCVSANVEVKHYTYPSSLGYKSFWGGASSRVLGKYGSLTFTRLLLQTILSPFKAVYTALISRNSNVIPYIILFRLQILYGWLHWKKYLNLKR